MGDLIGIDQSTVSRKITKVTNAFVKLSKNRRPIWMPSQVEVNGSKVWFFSMAGLPNVFGCIDGTLIWIKSPGEREHEHVNRNNFHSINVQVGLDLVA